MQFDETNGCPVCGGWAVHLGTLGRLAHYRCRSCGYIHTAPANQTTEQTQTVDAVSTHQEV